MRFQLRELSKKSPEFINHIYNVAESIKDETYFHTAVEKDFEHLHNLLESETMELGGFANLRYSRRPDLVSSYFESLQNPGIITDKANHFYGAINQIEILQYGKATLQYYSSDLRFSKSVELRVKASFRKMYFKVIAGLDRDCFTAVLKDNAAALKALTGKNSNFFYHKLHEYSSHTILILPSLSFIKSNKDFDIVAGRDISFEQSQLKLSSFSHGTSSTDDYFLIKNKGNTIGSFSVTRPKCRKLLIQPKSRRARIWSKLANKMFGHDYEEKVPWVYMTSFYLEGSFSKGEALIAALKYLYREELICAGELLLYCSSQDGESFPKLPTPVFQTDGILFKVSLEDSFEALKGPVYLNPICL